LVLIIDDTPEDKSLEECEKLFILNKIPYKVIKREVWQKRMTSGHYGSFFKKFSTINSIPLGRTILQHHLFTETTEMKNPIYWIIDDDITFSSTTYNMSNKQPINIFNIINEYYGKADAIIGAMSCDPPVPTLNCIRGQLVDFLHSFQANSSINSDYLKIKLKPDYYYDLSDIHSDHLEVPIYHSFTTDNDLLQIFSGKALSRKAIQREFKGEEKTISKRGANTIVLNRNLLQLYPVINIEVSNKFARRGDLTWALLSQLVAEKKFIEHTFSLDHNRPMSDFNLNNELEKAAYDIIGYSFNKAMLIVINQIKKETKYYSPNIFFEKINQKQYYEEILKTYNHYLIRRKTRFLMNYHRVIGLTKIIAEKYEVANFFYNKASEGKHLDIFYSLFSEAQNETIFKTFIDNFYNTIQDYHNSIANSLFDVKVHQKIIEDYFKLKKPLKLLGKGNEGVAFSDDIWVYKSFHEIPEITWLYLKSISKNFIHCGMLEKIEMFDNTEKKIIRYPFHPFTELDAIDKSDLISFLKFCKDNSFVFTNINAKNIIKTISGNIKFIDYGISFEQYSESKFANAVKRAYLLYRFPRMEQDKVKILIEKINIGEIPNEINGWKEFYGEL
jgi:hypothetical protein